tara:strand:+ start:730 stop:966 length:237 start_codon:yes stop_codon:yes gene_type:complete
MIKILRLDGKWIISEIEEIPGVELGDPDCVLKSPCEITDDRELINYPPYSKDEEIAVRSTDIFVIAEPDDEILKLYND